MCTLYAPLKLFIAAPCCTLLAGDLHTREEVSMSTTIIGAGEATLKLNDVGKYLPHGRNNAPVSLGTVLRWVLQGVRGPGGERVRLEAVRVGGKWVTSVEALARFAEAQTPRLEDETPPRPRTPTQRRRSHE